MTKRGERRGLLVTGTLAAAILAFALFAVVLPYDMARRFAHHRSARPTETPADSGLSFDVVPLLPRDGTAIEGWWVPPRDGARRPDLAVVILAHGNDERGKAHMLRHAGYLHRAGYILLLFDFRSYGGSGGSMRSGGFLERQDLSAAVRLARARALGAPIAVLGESEGASIACIVAAEDPFIRCLVLDSPIPTLEGQLARDVGASGVTAVPYPARLALGWLERIVGHDMKAEEMSAARAARHLADRPVMLVFGTKDEVVPAGEWRPLLASLGPANRTWAWIVPGGRHAEALDEHAGEYAARVVEFLDAAFAARDSASGGKAP